MTAIVASFPLVQLARLAPSTRRTADEILTLALRAYEEGLRDLEVFEHLDDVLDVQVQAFAAQRQLRRILRDRATYVKVGNLLAELRLQQQRTVGRWLREHVRHGGGGDRRSLSRGRTVVGDIPEGISRNQSSSWQRLAASPQTAFERFIAATRDAGREITTAGRLRLAPPSERARAQKPRKSRWSCGCTPVIPLSGTMHARCERCGNRFAPLEQ